MKIINQDGSIHVTKDNGTEVYYYLFDEYEIHQNCLPPNITQEWHKHEKIEEILFMLKGELTIYFEDNHKKKEVVVRPFDLVRFEDTFHTLRNNTNSNIEFLIFKLVLDGNSKRQIIKNDKILRNLGD